MTGALMLGELSALTLKQCVLTIHENCTECHRWQWYGQYESAFGP